MLKTCQLVNILGGTVVYEAIKTIMLGLLFLFSLFLSSFFQHFLNTVFESIEQMVSKSIPKTLLPLKKKKKKLKWDKPIFSNKN